jgi:ATP-binding cassette subfamily B protein
VAIARALVKDAKILVLDEATSSLDSESEHLIQEGLWTLMQGRTVIAIAHRLSTVASMDRIVYLEAGRIIEDGPHRELLAKGGAYAKLWNRQMGGFIDAA